MGNLFGMDASTEPHWGDFSIRRLRCLSEETEESKSPLRSAWCPRFNGARGLQAMWRGPMRVVLIAKKMRIAQAQVNVIEVHIVVSSNRSAFRIGLPNQ